MLRRIDALSLTLSLVLLALNIAVAQDAPTAAPEPRPIPVLPRLCLLQSMRFLSPVTLPSLGARLSLTDEQKTKINDLLAKADETLKPLVETQRQAAENFAVAMAKPETDQAALLAAADKAMKAEAAIMNERVKTFGELKALLDDKQKAELSKYLEHTRTWWRASGSPGQVPMTLPAPPPPVAPPAELKQ